LVAGLPLELPDYHSRESDDIERAHCVSSRHLPERGIEHIRRHALHVRRHVAVPVERHRDVGMAEALLDDLRMDALRQEQRRARVPEVMDTGSIICRASKEFGS
jgi:hypothetical protein